MSEAGSGLTKHEDEDNPGSFMLSAADLLVELYH